MTENSSAARAQVLRLAIDVVHQNSLWPELCDALCGALGGTAVMVFEFDFEAFTAPIFRGTRNIALSMPLVEATMEGRVPQVEIDGYSRFAGFPRGVLFGEYEVYGLEHDAHLPENPYRDAVLAATGSASRSVMRLNDIGPWSDVAAVHLPYPAAEIQPLFREEAQLLLSLVGRSIDASRAVNGLMRVNQALSSAFDRLDFAAAICEPSGRIVIANSEFRAMAAERDGLLEAAGFVAATHTADRLKLSAAVRAAANSHTSAKAHICRLSRRLGRLPLIARTIPINGTDLGRGRETFTLLLVIDPESEDRVSADGIDTLGLLSQAELEVCRLIVKGQATAEIASRRGTTVQTATDQVKSALSKLACASRLDIVRLAMATKPPGRS